MSTKKTRTPIRVVINTTILVTLSVAFAAIAICHAFQLDQYNNKLKEAHYISNKPGLCYDIVDDSDGIITDNERICGPGTEEKVTDPNQLALYLDDQVNFVGDMSIYASVHTMLLIGAFFSLSSLAAAIIYWNHNRIKK